MPPLPAFPTLRLYDEATSIIIIISYLSSYYLSELQLYSSIYTSSHSIVSGPMSSIAVFAFFRNLLGYWHSECLVRRYHMLLGIIRMHNRPTAAVQVRTPYSHAGRLFASPSFVPAFYLQWASRAEVSSIATCPQQ